MVDLGTSSSSGRFIGGALRSLAGRGVVTIFALAVVVALGFSATPARAVVAELGGHGYGMTPITGVDEAQLVSAYESRHESSLSAAPSASPYDVGPLGGTQLVNVENGPVMHSVTTHVIYWDPSKEFTAATKAIVDGFFGNVAHDSGLPTNVFAVAGQYTDRTGNAAYVSTATASQVDTDAFPANQCAPAPGGDPGPPYTKCLLDSGLQEELSRFIAAGHLPVGPTQLYLLLLPHRVATCLEEEAEIAPGVVEQVCSNNFFCAYHSYIEPGTAGEIIYATIPFSLLDSVGDTKGCQDDGLPVIQQPNPDNANGKESETRFADVALKYVSHEYIEAVTDPLVGVQTAWVDAHGLEIGDKCNGVDGPSSGEGRDPNSFLPVLGGLAAEGTLFNQAINTGHYYLQSEWDNAAKACRMRPLSLGEGSFAVPPATAGASVTFTGSAFDPYPGFEPTWTFGDGATGSGRTATHTYATAGEFIVTMTPRDRLTNATGVPVSHAIVVGAAPVAAVPVAVAPLPPPPPAAVASVTPHSTFAAATAVVDQKTGVVTLTTSVLDPGMFKFRATFANGRFGAFASAVCRKPRIRLAGRCLPATIVYASGSKALAASGTVRVTLKPSASALKALGRALRQRRGLPLTLVLTFQSARGGTAFTRSQTLVVRPRR
jgi:hypothetical protein